MPRIDSASSASTNGWEGFPNPFWQHPMNKAQLHLGDVLTVLRTFHSRSVQCVVTSPPYWGLRDYGICPCRKGRVQDATSTLKGSQAGTPEMFGSPDPNCLKCGGTGKDLSMVAQLGREERHDCLGWARSLPGLPCNCAERDWKTSCHVCRMVLVFREVRRVLRDDGTLWLNYGDTSLPSGNLAGVPWRVALALQADGWILRQEIIWSKPAPLPESVKNRCTKSHEQVFLFANQQNYFYDMEAIKEDMVRVPHSPGNKKVAPERNDKGHLNEHDRVFGDGRRNKRSVWTVSSESYAESHYASFPRKLIELMILAGTSAKGCCSECGKPWQRVVESTKLTRSRPNDYVKRSGEDGTGNSCGNTVAGVANRTVGWMKDCSCKLPDGSDPPVTPCIVLDPFIGSGTTGLVCVERGRRCVGIDLSEEYLTNHAIKRIMSAEIVQSDPLAEIRPAVVEKPAEFNKPMRFKRG